METSPGSEKGIDFRRLPDIERLPPPYQMQLLSQARVQRCADGQTLFKVGDVDDAAVYLLEGVVVMIGSDASVREIHGTDPEARAPLDPAQPRRHTVRAVGSATVLHVKRSLLEKLTALADLQSARSVDIAEVTFGDPGTWMTRISRAPLFARLPPRNLLLLFERGHVLNVGASAVVAAQGSSPGYFYVVQDGEFRMQRATREGANALDAIPLNPGDCFGAEALLTERPLDASVTAVSAGMLVRFEREDFLKLIVEPLIQAIPLRQAGELVRSQRARWLDVRAAPMAADIKGERALHIPLQELRLRLGSLPRQMPYIVTSDSSACSRAGVFILLDAGIEARYLTDVAAVASPPEQQPAHPAPAPAAIVPEPVPVQVQVTEPVRQEVVPLAPAAAAPVISEPPPAPVNSVLGDIGTRLHREIDAQMTALKERVEQALAEQSRLLDRSMQEEVRRKTAEMETRYQIMVVRKEQMLRKSYERVLAMAASMRQQFDELQQAHTGFDQLLGEGIKSSDAPSTDPEQTAGERPV